MHPYAYESPERCHPLAKQVQQRQNVTFDKEYGWSVINSTLEGLTLGPSWEVIRAGSSMSVMSRKKRITLKITLTREVYVDLPVGTWDFKSEKYPFDTIEEAAKKFVEVLKKYAQRVSPH